jgi:hypothetical protein
MSPPANRDLHRPFKTHFHARGPDALSAQYGQMTSGERRAADLARVRENQRRSRARRREYVADLETRLRQWEVQGVEASAEVAMGARRVAEENRQLRDLLHAHGVDDRRIAQHVQHIAANSEVTSGTIPPIAGESAVQTLEHLMAPRRPTPLEPPGPAFTILSQASREHLAPSPDAADFPEWESTSAHGSGSAPASYGSPTIGTLPNRTADPQHTSARTLPPLTSEASLSQAYFSESDLGSAYYRQSRCDTITPSRVFEDEDQSHYTTQTSRPDDSTNTKATRASSSVNTPMYDYVRSGDYWPPSLTAKDQGPFMH